MEALSEAPAIFRRQPHLNRSAGRLEDRHQVSTPARVAVAASAPAPPEAEVAMQTTTSHPPKHLVREYLERRSKDTTPPPTPEEIRRQLGWGMLMPADERTGTSRS
jgi:hypothetical protein